MRRILLSLIISLSIISVCAQMPIRRIDARELTFINKSIKTPVVYHRADTSLYKFSPIVNRYYRYSTGMAVVFKTNSRNIYADWTTLENKTRSNMTPISQTGMDLYIMKDGKWIFAGCATPKTNTTIQSAAVVANMDNNMKLCMLYLPLFEEVTSLKIGIDADAEISSAYNPFRHKIVVMGSSITHGAAASRPGMAYPAMLERRTGLQFTNLGTSGQSKLQPEMAQLIADCQADAFVFDCFSNPSAKEIEERLKPFIDTIRAAHPDTPLIFLQTIVREGGNFNLNVQTVETERRNAADSLMKTYTVIDKNLYFLNPGMNIGEDHDGTVDGTHPTDLGFDRMVTYIQPRIVEILKRYGIE